MTRAFDTGIFARLSASRSGVSTVEFALIAIPLLALIFGTMQNLIVSTARITLDSALQSLAYDIANADEKDLPGLLSRSRLCEKPALFLSECNSGSDVCIRFTRFDEAPGQNNLVTECRKGNGGAQNQGCCYQLIVEYPLPAALDLISYIWPSRGEEYRPKIIRAIAFAYRA